MEYDCKAFTNLCVVSGYYKSNKSKDNCNYACLYNNVFNDYRQEEMRMLEFEPSNENEKLTLGGSLKMWHTFLSKTEIIGVYEREDLKTQADNSLNDLRDKDTGELERVLSVVCEDVSKDGLRQFFERPELQERFDVIIDASNRALDDKLKVFHNTIQQLVPQGFYFIENIDANESDEICRRISDLKEYYPVLEFFFEVVHNPINMTDHPLVIVQRLRD
jgi:hypothetical protein